MRKKRSEARIRQEVAAPMTEPPVVTDKKPMPKADMSIEIPAWTKKLVMENPFTGKPQPLSWFWRKLAADVREGMLAAHAETTAALAAEEAQHVEGETSPEGTR